MPFRGPQRPKAVAQSARTQPPSDQSARRRSALTMEPDIRRARMLAPEVYLEPRYLARARARIFARSWQLLLDGDRAIEAGEIVPGEALPVDLLLGFLNEPLLLSRDLDGRLHALSNVCTHRGNLLCTARQRTGRLRCSYHGRRFCLDGRFLSMPECDEAVDFPSKSDDLPRLALGSFGPFTFVRLIDPRPAAGAGPETVEDWLRPLTERLGFLPLDGLKFDGARTRHFDVAASWILYVDNYLEGFHIPYVHPELAATLDYQSYATELFPGGVLQVGTAAAGEERFDLPDTSPDRGRAIAAYYYWFFPNLMLNVYPWGISVNVVTPLAVDRTRISFFGYVMDASKTNRGPGAALDLVEQQDEAVVQQVQRGVRSWLYRPGRYAPAREQGVHHFHRMLAAALGKRSSRPAGARSRAPVRVSRP